MMNTESVCTNAQLTAAIEEFEIMRGFLVAASKTNRANKESAEIVLNSLEFELPPGVELTPETMCLALMFACDKLRTWN